MNVTGLEKIASFAFVMIVCKILRRNLKQELLILMVKEEVIVSSQVDISDLSQGIYVSQLLENGSVVGMTKFIKN